MHSAFSEPHYIPQGAFTYFDTYLVQGKGFKSLWAPYWNDNKNFFSVGQPRDFLVRNEIEGRNAEDRFNTKYKNKTTVLMLISAHDNVLSPFFLLKQKHEGIDKLFELSDDIHLILRPRRANAIDSFFAYCPELAPRLESGQISIVTGEFTTQELMSYSNILISEDSSSSLLESLPRDDLFAFYFMIRYGEFLPQQNLVVFNAQELVDMVKTYISRPQLKAEVLLAKSRLKDQYTTQPAGETWKRIAGYLES
jgi:hypothetical protein